MSASDGVRIVFRLKLPEISELAIISFMPCVYSDDAMMHLLALSMKSLGGMS